MNFTTKAVQAGSTDKGDVLVTLEFQNSEKREIEIISKVKSKFGEAILKDATQVLDQAQIQGARLLIEDNGALGFALRARIKTAISRAQKN